MFGRKQNSGASAEGNFLCQIADDPGKIRTLAIHGAEVHLLGKDGSIEATWIAREVTVERAKVQPAGSMVSKQGLRLTYGGSIDLLFPKNKLAMAYPDELLEQVFSALSGAGAKLLLP